MHSYLTPDNIALLFPDLNSAAQGMTISHFIEVEDGIELVGIDFAGTHTVMFFFEAYAYVGNDETTIIDMAQSWGGGVLPARGARIVKFFRLEADRETSFNPQSWPLPVPGLIWQFMDALEIALREHAVLYATVPQYFFIPQTAALDRMYNRLVRRFTDPSRGMTVRVIAQPENDEGGFYGFERI
ncbi:hypothetical protein ACQUFY_26230 (plasmid) [Robbsia andropogonis]|uniref:hypothetical protein n=1 Tax=Robbsia andropogonis TaxID=28092 RepID=UPI003D225701